MQNGRPFPSSAYKEAGFKLLRPGNLAANGKLDWAPKSTVYLDDHFAKDNKDWIVQPGDVVMNLTAQSLEDGFMGRVCLAREVDHSLLNQRLGRFICIDEINAEYIFRVFQTSYFRKMVESRCEGTKVRHTYFRHFADLPVVKLNTKKQKDVIQATQAVDHARKTAEDSLSASRSLLKQLIEQYVGNRKTSNV
jgi:type I restriction enzyme S subunit